MAYLHCGRCGLQIKIQASYMRIENCPRCLARSATASPLVHSANWISPALGFGGRERERHGTVRRDSA